MNQPRTATRTGPDSAVVQRSPPVPGGRYDIIDRLSGRPASGLLPVSRNTEGPHEPVSIIAELRSATVTHCRRRERASSYRSLRRIRTSNEPKARRSERSRRSVRGNHSSIVGVAGDARFVDRPGEDQVLTTGGQLRDLAALLHRGEQPAHFRLRPVPAFDDPGLFHVTAVRDEQSEDHLLVGQLRPSGRGGSSGNAPSSERSDGTGGGWNVGGVRSDLFRRTIAGVPLPVPQPRPREGRRAARAHSQRSERIGSPSVPHTGEAAVSAPTRNGTSIHGSVVGPPCSRSDHRGSGSRSSRVDRRHGPSSTAIATVTAAYTSVMTSPSPTFDSTVDGTRSIRTTPINRRLRRVTPT